MTDTWNPLVRSQEPFSDASAHGPDIWVRLTRMERLGASVQELAREQYESIMGYTPTHGDPAIDVILGEPKDGHKPPRPDIQKMKHVWEEIYTGLSNRDIQEKYQLTTREQGYMAAYNMLMREYHSQEHAFNALAAVYDSLWNTDSGRAEAPEGWVAPRPLQGDTFDPKVDDPPTQQAKRAVGQMLKKAEEASWSKLYPAISVTLGELLRAHPESYKMWPWLVKHMKAEATEAVAYGRAPTGNARFDFTHEVDVVGEGGKILNQLRQDNQLPQNFDIAKLTFEEFENWLMDWKRENRESTATGEVVYEFHNKWTIQKLTSPESLQFEGDEMGHCVGGYSQAVQSGRTGIYSLRDEKGMPHVTMEIEYPVAYKSVSQKPIGEFEAEDLQQHMPDLHTKHKAMPHFENEEQAAEYRQQYQHHPEETRRQWPDYLHEPAYPSIENPDDLKNMYDFEGVPLKKEFGVVQVQGKGNKTPKPEYQRMMREFLDSVREKELTFNRSDNWYAPWDDQYGDDSSDTDPSSYRELQEWWENYQGDNHSWCNPKEDAYGLPADRKTVSGGYIDDIIENTMYGLADVYDRSKDFIRDWQGAAQQIYHLLNVQYLQERVNTPERREAEKKNWLAEIQAAEEKLNEWTFDMHYSNWEYIQERTQEKMEQRAETLGINLDNYEDEYGTVDWDRLEAEHEDEWREVQDTVREEDENDVYGNCYKFINYLYHLIEQNGHVGPAGLPDPNQKDAGLPSYQKLMDNLNIPGTFSKTISSSVTSRPIHS